MVYPKVDKFREFLLSEETENMFSLEVRIRILAELEKQPVGIRGLNKFVINNRFLANVSIYLFRHSDWLNY